MVIVTSVLSTVSFLLINVSDNLLDDLTEPTCPSLLRPLSVIPVLRLRRIKPSPLPLVVTIRPINPLSLVLLWTATKLPLLLIR